MKIEDLINEEFEEICEIYPMYASMHEGSSVLREELEECNEVMDSLEDAFDALWGGVRCDSYNTYEHKLETISANAKCLIMEAVQVCAVCEKAKKSINK